MQLIPPCKPAVDATGLGFVVLAARTHQQRTGIEETGVRQFVIVGETLVHLLENPLATPTLDPFAELRNRRQASRAKERAVMNPITRPAQGPIIPNRPQVHAHNQHVTELFSASHPRDRPFDTPHRRVHFSPNVAVHVAPPCSWTRHWRRKHGSHNTLQSTH